MTNPDIRAAFEAWHQKEFGYVDLGYSACDEAERRWITWQAATEAAKATSVAVGELPELPQPMHRHIDRPNGLSFLAEYYTDDQMRAYGQACAEAARQPAPVDEGQLKLICAAFGWRIDGDANVLADRVEHHIRDMKAGIKARDTVIAERDATLAATAAPVLKDAAIAVLREALDAAEVHPCDSNNDDARAKQLSSLMQNLYKVIRSQP